MKYGKILVYMVTLGVCILTACGSEGTKSVMTHKSSQVAMGTMVSQVYYGTDAQDMENRAACVAGFLDDLEKQGISWRESESEIARINENAGKGRVEVTEAMSSYLETAFEVSARSGGAFDITIGDVVQLWDLDAVAAGEKDFAMPTREELTERLQGSGYEKVALGDGYISLPEGMRLDMGAIGKGIACDEIYALCNDGEYATITGGIVSVGGSIVAMGQKPDGTPYRVSIVHPRKEGSIGVVTMKDGEFLSTSGDYERYAMYEGERYHHILDPKTGYPAKSGLCSVTVVSDSGLLSDALSTACFVLGEEMGMRLAQEYGAKILMVREDESFVMNAGMEEIFAVQ